MYTEKPRIYQLVYRFPNASVEDDLCGLCRDVTRLIKGQGLIPLRGGESRFIGEKKNENALAFNVFLVEEEEMRRRLKPAVVQILVSDTD
jgi:hypothetical protein